MVKSREQNLIQLAYLYHFNHERGDYEICAKLAESMLDQAKTKSVKKWCKRSIKAEGRVHIINLWTR